MSHIKQNRTKIVCTIGPATADERKLRALVDAGMDVARFNFSHGEYTLFESWHKLIREISHEKKQPVAILQDLQGPRIRVGGDIPKDGIILKSGDVWRVGFGAYRDGFLPIDYDGLVADLKIGSRILLVDGLIELKVSEISDNVAVCEVIEGGLVKPHKGVNVPNGNLSLSSMTHKDHEDLAWGVKNNVDYIALSFVRSAHDIEDLRNAIKKIDAQSKVHIIAKIEMHEAVENIDSILDVVDGVMVARGDLGIEIPAEDVPVTQKKIILKAIAAGKPVITATQMMESMIANPRPTRAEVSDVANAVFDGTDAVMLSGETAGGEYPVETVQMMTKIIAKIEKEIFKKNSWGFENFNRVDLDAVTHGAAHITSAQAIGSSVREAASELEARCIAVATLSGFTARMVSRDRPKIILYAFTPNEDVYRQLALVWGVRAFLMDYVDSADILMKNILSFLQVEGLAKKNDFVAIVAAHPLGTHGGSNMMKIEKL